MSQMLEIMQDEKTDIWDFFHDYASSLSEATASAYLKAIRSAQPYLLDMKSPAVCDIADWIVAIVRSGITLKTAAYYLDNIASLHNAAVREGLAPSSDAFKIVKARLRAISSSRNNAICGIEDSETVLSRLRSLIRHAGRQTGDTSLFTDLFILALLDPSRGLYKTAMLVKDDAAVLPEESQEIVRRHLSTRRKYIFPLQQSALTPRQLMLRLEAEISALMRQRGLPVFGSAATSVETLWALAAMECGFKASEVVATLGHVPAPLPLLSLADAAPIPDYKKGAIIESTAISLIDNPMQWHVMHLRQGVRMESVRRRLELFEDEITAPDIYYPCEEIARRIGKKLVYKEKPLIADVAFFRCRETEVYPLFQRIGDIAWCYREESAPGRPYSVVPDSSMMTFMQTVGILMPGMDVYPIGEIPLTKNDVVSILGGPFIGKEATVESLLQNEQPTTDNGQRTTENVVPTIVRLRITADNGIEWRVALPPTLLRPVSR